MRILAIGINTFREAVRNKLLYSLLFFALLMIVSSTLLGELSLHQNERIIKNLGLFSISFFGVVIAIFVGINLLYKEIDKKTIYTIVSKPIRRYQFVLGKYLGMLITLFVQVSVMSITLVGLLLLHDLDLGDSLGKALILSYGELALVTATAVLFSAFSSPFLSGFFTFGIFALGRLSSDLIHVLPQIEMSYLRGVLYWVAELLPNLWRFNVANRVIHGAEVSWSYVGWTLGYGAAYAAVVLTVACLLFARRDFT